MFPIMRNLVCSGASTQTPPINHPNHYSGRLEGDGRCLILVCSRCLSLCFYSLSGFYCDFTYYGQDHLLECTLCSKIHLDH